MPSHLVPQGCKLVKRGALLEESSLEFLQNTFYGWSSRHLNKPLQVTQLYCSKVSDIEDGTMGRVGSFRLDNRQACEWDPWIDHVSNACSFGDWQWLDVQLGLSILYSPS